MCTYRCEGVELRLQARAWSLEASVFLVSERRIRHTNFVALGSIQGVECFGQSQPLQRVAIEIFPIGSYMDAQTTSHFNTISCTLQSCSLYTKTQT